MRSIEKGLEPQILSRLRKEKSSWDLYGDERDPLRQSLLEEQRGLCAYCMGRVHASESKTNRMEIEHRVPRSDQIEGHARMFDWSNLLGVCTGGSSDEPHCGRSKDDRLIRLDPTRHPVEDFFRYNVQGSILPSKSVSNAISESLLDDLQILELNTPKLVRNRRRVVQGLRKALKSATNYRKVLNRLQDLYLVSRNPLPEYVEAARFYLRRHSS